MWRGRHQGGGGETTENLVSVGLTVSHLTRSSLLTSLSHSRLSDALKNTGFADAMKAAGLDTGTGSDGVLPARMSRQTEGAACTAILDDWKAFNTSGDKAVSGVGGDLDETETNNTIGALNKLNNK